MKKLFDLCYEVKPCGNVLALNGRNNVGKENKTKIKTSFFYIYNVYLKSKTKSEKKKRKLKVFRCFSQLFIEYGALASVAGSYCYK
jgi:hypothetical protein